MALYETVPIGYPWHQMYVNFGIDIFFIANSPSYCWSYNQVCKEKYDGPMAWPTKKIQHLIMHIGPYTWQPMHQQMTSLSGNFPNLRTLTIWKDRRHIVIKDGVAVKEGRWYECASDRHFHRNKAWASAKHEDRFVQAKTYEEEAQVQVELAKMQPWIDGEKIRNPKWTFEELKIIFRNPEIGSSRFGIPTLNEGDDWWHPEVSPTFEFFNTLSFCTLHPLGSTGYIMMSRAVRSMLRR